MENSKQVSLFIRESKMQLQPGMLFKELSINQQSSEHGCILTTCFRDNHLLSSVVATDKVEIYCNKKIDAISVPCLY